jgi:hypothetical protein
MTNTLITGGFRYLGLVDGSPPNFGIATGYCAYNASAMFAGDPLIISAGLLAPATVTGNTGAAVAGVAVSFSWISTAAGRRVWQDYYPSNDSVSNAAVEVRYVNNPDALFQAQTMGIYTGNTVGGPMVQADVGLGINFAPGAGGNTANQQSSFGLDFSTLNATVGVLPFYVYKLIAAPATDPTTAGNLVQVGFATLTKAG